MKSVPLLVVCLNIFSIFSSSWGQSNVWDNQPDSATGLSLRQKQILRETWSIVRKDPRGSGQAIMLHFLTQYPSYQRQFTKFSQVPIANLPYDPNFQRLCVAIIDSLSFVIDSLDNPNALVNTLVALAEDHKRLGVTVPQYIELQGTMMHVLGEALGCQWTPEVIATWHAALDTINGIILTAYL